MRRIAAVGLLLSIAATAMALAPQSTTVLVTIQVPAKVDSFKDRQLEVLLYETDPRVADRAATQVDKYLQPIYHDNGKDTTRIISIAAKAAINPQLRYYVTVFVVDAAGNRTHIGERDGKSGLSYVLTDGSPYIITMIARPVS
jgi:hypothetical protein